jgi:hypothetical protein
MATSASPRAARAGVETSKSHQRLTRARLQPSRRRVERTEALAGEGETVRWREDQAEAAAAAQEVAENEANVSSIRATRATAEDGAEPRDQRYAQARRTTLRRRRA